MFTCFILQDKCRRFSHIGSYFNNPMEDETIIIVCVLSAAWLLVFIITILLYVRVTRLQRTVQEMQATGKIRVQKLKINGDKNHAFQNPALSPDEELSRRGYSMYMPDERDAESGRGTTERQAAGQFVEELTREIDYRQQRRSASPALQDPRNIADPRPDYHNVTDSRSHNNYDRGFADSRRDFDPRVDNRQSTAPPFLLQAIEENKRKSRLANPVANGGGRQSDTNPNFIY